MGKKCKWIEFVSNGNKLPKERELVFVATQRSPDRTLGLLASFPLRTSVGYLRFAAGDKKSPYFVIPGGNGETVIAWSHGVPEDFKFPKGED